MALRAKKDDPRCLSQKNVSNLELSKIRIARTVLPCISELFCGRSSASVHSSHKFYEDWPFTLLDEGSCQYN